MEDPSPFEEIPASVGARNCRKPAPKSAGNEEDNPFSVLQVLESISSNFPGQPRPAIGARHVAHNTTFASGQVEAVIPHRSRQNLRSKSSPEQGDTPKPPLLSTLLADPHHPRPVKDYRHEAHATSSTAKPSSDVAATPHRWKTTRKIPAGQGSRQLLSSLGLPSGRPESSPTSI